MKTGYAVALALATFALGAFLTTAVAHGGMGGMMNAMSAEQWQQMFDACQSMMESQSSP